MLPPISFSVQAQEDPVVAPVVISSGLSEVVEVLTAQQVSDTCYQWIVDEPQHAGSWERSTWSHAPTGSEVYWDSAADGARFAFTITEDPGWGTPVSATYSWYRFKIGEGSDGALVLETVVGGSGTGTGWAQPSGDMSATPSHHSANSSDVTVNGGIIYTNGGEKLGWDELKLVKCYHASSPTSTPNPTNTPRPTVTPQPTSTQRPTATPWPTATPSPTFTPTATSTNTPRPTATNTPLPTATPVAGDTTFVVPTAAAVTTVQSLEEVCKDIYLALVQQGGAAATATAAEANTNIFAPVKALSSCVDAKYVGIGVGGNMCWNPKRVLVVKDTEQAQNAWVVEYRCEEPQGPVAFGSTTSMNPGTAVVGGIMALAMATYYWGAQPTTVELYWEPHIPDAELAAGLMIAQTWEEARDFVLSMSYKPTTMHYGNPTSYGQFFDGSDVSASVRFYRPVSQTLWDSNVWFYTASNNVVDNDTIALLQFVTPGSTGTALNSFILSSRSDGTPGQTLYEAMSLLIGYAYSVPKLYDGVRARSGSHSSDGDPVATAKKDAMWATVLNWAYAWTSVNQRPPWDWCGFRPSDGACSCINYWFKISRWVVNGAGVLKEKITEGLSVILNSNGTALGGFKPTNPSAAKMSEGMRPTRLYPSETWETLDPNDPNSWKRAGNCSDDFGLQFAPATN